MHWAFLLGGLVILADLSVMMLQQRQGGAADGGLLESLDLVVSALLYSVAGALVFRDTRRVTLAASAGLLAGVLDGLVVGAASSMIVPVATSAAGSSTSTIWLDLLTWNVTLGTVLAAASAWIASLVSRTGAGRARGG